MCEPDFGTMCFQMFVFMLFILPGTDTVSKADAERNLSTIKVVNSSWFFPEFDDLASLMQELVAQIRALLLWRAVCSSYDLSSWSISQVKINTLS